MIEVVYLLVLVAAGALIATLMISTLIGRFGIDRDNLWRPVLLKEKFVVGIIAAGLIGILGVLAIALIKSVEAL